MFNLIILHPEYYGEELQTFTTQEDRDQVIEGYKQMFCNNNLEDARYITFEGVIHNLK